MTNSRPLPFRSILVTGGKGFVGRHLVAALSEAAPNARIQVTSLKPEPGAIAMDLDDADSVARAVEEVAPDLVIHLAGQSSVGASQGAAAKTWRANACGTLHLAEAISRYSPTAIMLFVSSVEVYGAAFVDSEVDEQTVPQPISAYAQSKLAAEKILLSVLPSTTQLIIARPTNHVGLGQDDRFVTAAFARQIAEIELGLKPAVLEVGNLDSHRDFMDVADVVQAYLALLAGSHDLPPRSTWNIASGHSRSIRSILEDLIAIGTVKPQIVVDPQRYRPNDIPMAAINTFALRDATGWKPEIAWSQSIARVLEAQRQHVSAARSDTAR